MRDRSRVLDHDRLPPLPPGNGGRLGTVLIDGRLAATWRITTPAPGALLTVEPLATVSGRDGLALEEEGRRLLEFVAGDSAHDIRLAAPHS